MTSRRTWQIVFSLFTLTALALGLVQVPTPVAQAKPAAQEQPILVPAIGYSIKNDLSKPLIELAKEAGKAPPAEEDRPLGWMPKSELAGINGIDEVLQSNAPLSMPAPIANFDGVNNISGVLPPDTQGEIGYDPATGTKYYVQWVNLAYQMWDVTNPAAPVSVLGPTNGNVLWTGFGGACETTNDGDPITLFDQFANRWVMTQFALPNYPSGPFYECIAVSTTGDPTGSWYRYGFTVHATKMDDYPKLGVWPDATNNAYYMSVNQFTSTWAGAGAFAFDRAKMLAGQPATFVYFDLAGVNINMGGMLPSDLDGNALPAAGTPGYFAEVDDSTAFGDPADTFRIWEFHVNWTTPGLSTFGNPASTDPAKANYKFTVPNFNMLCTSTRNCIDQPGTTQNLDAIADRLMHRLAYRIVNGTPTMVTNHTVDAGSGVAGVRWYEMTWSGSTWALRNKGTFAPADGMSRWMGSAAMDASGNLALGYSGSSGTIYPSIYYAGRLYGDPADTLGQGESLMFAGTGSQTHSAARWGDYSAMTIDPVDDCTFWYTTEYIQTTGSAPWRTRIGSFRYPSCALPDSGTLEGTVTSTAGGAPIQGAIVTNGTYSTTTGADGHYTMTLPVGTHDITASAYGFSPATVNDVEITLDSTTTQDFALSPLPAATVYGVVTDDSGHGYPLYARIDISAPGFTTSVYTNPFDGSYSVDLLQDATYDFTVTVLVPGYTPQTVSVTPTTDPYNQDFDMLIDEASCSAPGYAPEYVWYEKFEGDNGGFTSGGTANSWAWGAPTSGPNAAHSGSSLWATNLAGQYNNSEDSYIISPAIDLSGFAGQTPILKWWEWVETEAGYDYIYFDVSKDGGSTWAQGLYTFNGAATSWQQKTVVLDPTYSVANFKIRYRFHSDSSVPKLGWYVDDIGIGMASIPPATTLFSSDFEATNGGFVAAGTASSWAWGTPTSGPMGAHSGVKLWATNLAGNYNNSEDSTITSPVIDLSAQTGKQIVVSWWQWSNSESNYDFIYTDVSKDGGANWIQIYAFTGNASSWQEKSFSVDSSYAVANFKVRFRFHSDSTVNSYAGWYVDDVVVAAREPVVIAIPCTAIQGGLLAGFVTDANTSDPLNGVIVESGNTGASTLTAATPMDDGLNDGFYWMFAPTPPTDQDIFATGPAGYAVGNAVVSISDDGIVQQDFALAAGVLTVDPTSVSVSVPMGGSTTATLTLDNMGGADADFELKEIDGGFVPAGPFQTPTFLVKPFRQHFETTKGVGIDNRMRIRALPYAAGHVLSTFTPGVQIWGAAVNLQDGKVWANSPSPAWTGVNKLIEYTPTGTATGTEWSFSWNPANGPGDVAYNLNTGTFWVVDIPAAGASCIYEIDPATGVTGDTICPAVGVSQRGLAYDPATDTYYIGGWNDFMIHQFKPDGTILRSINMGSLGIAGLAYNPTTQHLFVQVNGTTNPVVVLDASQPTLPILGQFTVDSGFEVSGNGAGFEMDCDGNLWEGARADDKVYQFESGETTDMCAFDVAWLTEDPFSGTVAAGGTQEITLTFDASVVAMPGTYSAELKVKENTPYSVANIPVTMVVEAPVEYGTMTGVVNGLALCDAPGAPLADVTVNFYDSTHTLLYTMTTVAGGAFTYSAPAGDYYIEVIHTGYVSMETMVTVTEGGTTTQNFAMRMDAPCINAAPTSISVTVPPNQTTHRTLTLTNSGAGAGDFSIVEKAVIKLFADPSQVTANLIQDPSFEIGDGAGSPWTQYSLNYGTPLCTEAVCGTGGTPPGPHAGTWWAWFGGSSVAENGYVSQSLTFPAGSAATLTFYQKVPACANGASDYMNIQIDGTEVYRVNATDASCGTNAYVLKTVDLTAYANGAAHVVKFYSSVLGGSVSNFWVDDVSLEVVESTDVPWLSVAPLSGNILGDSTTDVAITFNATALAVGTYNAKLGVNRTGMAQQEVLVEMIVGDLKFFLPMISK